MKKRNLTCIVCPRGCSIEVELEDSGAVKTVTGYTCKRGFEYAENECTHPKRTVTSTAKTADGGVVSVKTASAIPKEKVFDVMAEIRKITLPEHVKIGDTAIENVCETGVNVVVTSNR